MVRVRCTSILLAVAVGLGLASAPAHAGVGAWTPLGPDGGSIYTLAVDRGDESVVYAASSNSVFRSDDGGDSWSFAGAGLRVQMPGIRTLAASGDAVLAGTWDGLWRSADGGRSWQLVRAGLPERLQVEVVLADPRRNERLWAGTTEGLFASDDRGATWRRSGELTPPAVFGLAIDPSTGQLYANGANGLFTSTDDGATWTLLRCLARGCEGAVVDPHHAGTLFTSAGGVLRSRDAGATWEEVRRPPLSSASLFELIGFHGDRLFGRVRTYGFGTLDDRLYWSDDHGDHWSAAAHQPADRAFEPLASSGGTLYLGSFGRIGGVFRSSDGGNHWEPASSGLSARRIERLAVDPLQPGVLFAQAPSHLLASDDDGASWRLSLAASIHGAGLGDLLPDPPWPGRVWSAAGSGLCRGDAGGRRWTPVRRVGSAVRALAADPSLAGGLWAGTSNAFYHSPNGRTWKRVWPARGERLDVRDVAVAPADARVVWVAGEAFSADLWSLGPRLYRSSDRGQSWERRHDGLPDGPVTSVALDASQLDTVFVTAGNGLYRSRDGGATWQQLPSPLASANPQFGSWRVSASPTAPTTLYAHLDTPDDEGVYRSHDEGETWQRVGAGTGEAGAGSVRALVIDPHDPRRLLIGTANRGILEWIEP